MNKLLAIIKDKLAIRRAEKAKVSYDRGYAWGYQEAKLVAAEGKSTQIIIELLCYGQLACPNNDYFQGAVDACKLIEHRRINNAKSYETISGYHGQI